MRALPLLLLLVLPPPQADGKVIAVDVPAGAEEIADPLRQSRWVRWIVSQNEGLAVTVAPGATGDVDILVRPLPVDGEVAGLLGGVPVRVVEGALELDGTVYRDPGMGFAVRLPRFEKRTWLVTGQRLDRLTELAGLVLLKEAGARVWGRGDEPFDYLLQANRWLERSGVWRPRPTETGDAGATVYAVDRGAERNDFMARDDYYGAMRAIPGRGVVLSAAPETAARPEVRELAKRLDAAAREMAKRVPLDFEEPVRVVIERDYVAQGRHLGDVGEAVLAADGAVHVVYHPRDEHAYLHGIARALLERAGVTGGHSPWIADGAALWLSERWYGRDWRDWLPRFAAADVLPRAEELMSAEEQHDASAPLWTPAAASLVDALPGETLRDKLEAVPGVPAVRAHLARLASSSRRSAERPTRPDADPPFLHGISFAMLNRIEGGYHAPSIDGQLERFRDLGADAVSLMPFAYQSRPDDPRLSFLNRSPTSETDVGVQHAARWARDAGFQVLWKPHIWVSHESWPGEIAMADEAGWAFWWRSYHRYVAHHAFLAEWTGSELFSIGVELGKTLEREREWRRLIETVRWLYSGAVTYAGNWHSDYDRAPFWDALDFIGVDAYFPLADGENASPDAVAAGAREVAERLRRAAERYHKPVILTEVGYAARKGAWVEPYAEGGDFSAEHQEIAYRALFNALGRPLWLRGVFAWKAFSADRGGDAGTRADFRFLGRPAEEAVRDYFLPPDRRAAAATE